MGLDFGSFLLMPSDGNQQNNIKADGNSEQATDKTVASVRDSLEFAERKNKKAKKAKLPPLEPETEKKEKKKAKRSTEQQRPFVRPKAEYRFSTDNRDSKNRSFRGYRPHRKITKVEYENALRQYQKNRAAARREAIKSNKGDSPEYTATDYIAIKKEIADSVKRPRFRAIKAHGTTLIVVLSFLLFRFTSVFIPKAQREDAYKKLLKKNAQLIYKTIVNVQGLFVKFGQLVSIVSYAVPEEFREELEGLQDKVPQRPVENIIKRIESDLGRPIESVFSHFNAEALAAASLAQVHEATLITGERVAVKVQHIGIEQEVKSDLRTFNQITKIADFFLRVNGLKRAQEQITGSIMDELRYEKEAAHLENFHKNYSDAKDVHIPKVHTKYCTEHVLVMEYVEGIKANDYRKLDDFGINRPEVAQHILETFCQMVFKDGLIHGDPHPGNILVNEDATITLIDFGSVIELNPVLRQGIIDLVFGGLTRNTRRILSGLRKVGYLTPHADMSLVEKLVDYTYESLLEGGIKLDNFSLDQIEFDQDLAKVILKDLHHLDISYDEIRDSFQLPQDVMMMGRMLMMLGGLVYEIDPNIRPFDIIRPYLQKFILSGGGDWKATVSEGVLGFGMGALQTIDNARYVIDKAKKGDLQVNVKDERKSRYLTYYLFQQFISVLLAGSSASAGIYMWVQGDIPLAQIGALAAAIFSWSAIRASKSAKGFRR